MTYIARIFAPAGVDRSFALAFEQTVEPHELRCFMPDNETSDAAYATAVAWFVPQVWKEALEAKLEDDPSEDLANWMHAARTSYYAVTVHKENEDGSETYINTF